MMRQRPVVIRRIGADTISAAHLAVIKRHIERTAISTKDISLNNSSNTKSCSTAEMEDEVEGDAC